MASYFVITARAIIFCCLLHYYCYATENNGDVRLVGGPNEFEGRVKVYEGGVWARWCHPGGSINTTTVRVVCRQLGHDEGGVFPMGSYGIGNESSAISNVSCQGTENNITECMHTSTTAPGNCSDVGLYCRDPTCNNNNGEVRLTDNITSTEGRVEICESGFRAGLCYENFTPEIARVLCRQLGLSTNNANGSGTGAISYSRGISTSHCTCTGDEIGFDQCQSISVFQLCSRVRLNCPESRRGDSTEEGTNTSSGSRSGNTDIATTSTCTTATAASTSTGTGTDGTGTGTAANTADNVADNTPAPPTVVGIVLGVVCGVLVLLLLCGGIFLALILRKKCKMGSSKVILDKNGTAMSNINYELSSKPQPTNADERTVTNILYTQTDVASSPHNVDNYAELESSRSYQSTSVPQHTLLHSSNTSDSGSHTYSKPTTPCSNNKTGNSFSLDTSAAGYSEVENELSYSKLDNTHGNSLSNSQVDPREYSHIDKAHQYSKLDSMNSKGYSTLDANQQEVFTHGHQQQQEESSTLPQPYEIPFSPNETGTSASISHTYSTVKDEVGSTGYSKLHIFDGESDRSRMFSRNEKRQKSPSSAVCSSGNVMDPSRYETASIQDASSQEIQEVYIGQQHETDKDDDMVINNAYESSGNGISGANQN